MSGNTLLKSVGPTKNPSLFTRSLPSLSRFTSFETLSIIDVILSWDTLSITGPILISGPRTGAPTFKLFIASISFSLRGFAISPTPIKRDPAIHLCPAQPKEALITALRVESGSASGITTKAFFAAPPA